MLDASTVERLRAIDTRGAPVVSLFVGLGPDLDVLRSVPARVKALLAPQWELAESGSIPSDHARSLKTDLDRVAEMAESLGSDLGRGAALFVSSPAGLAERIALPAGVRDRAIVGPDPYLLPLEAMLDHFHRYCAVVLDRRTASIYRFHMGDLESWEVIGEEEIRKDNYGGFEGNAEHRVRGHAEAVARRLFKSVAERVAVLARGGEFDLLAIGGGRSNVDGLIAALAPDVGRRLAGTFTVDLRTATPAEVRDRCREVADAHDRAEDARMVAEVRDAAAAGGRAVMGMTSVLDALNQRAVDRLLVAAQRREPGVECTGCHWLGAVGMTDCPSCGSEVRASVDLVDAATRAARDQGGSVRFLLGESPLAGAGLAALLRHPISVDR